MFEHIKNLNHARHALINLKCVVFSSLLTYVCDSKISYQMICRRRNHFVANYKEVVFNNTQLRLNFDNFYSTINVSKEDIRNVFMNLENRFGLKQFIQD